MKTGLLMSCLMIICAICGENDPDVTKYAVMIGAPNTTLSLKTLSLQAYSYKRVQRAIESEVEAKKLAVEATDRIMSYRKMLEDVLAEAKPGSKSVIPVAEALWHFPMSEFGIQSALKHIAIVDPRWKSSIPENLDRKVAAFLHRVSEFDKYPIVQLLLFQGQRTVPYVLAALQKYHSESIEFRNALYIVWSFKRRDTAKLISQCQLTQEQKKKAAKILKEWL